MVKFYALQIQLGKITIDDVPVKYCEAVRKYLEGENNAIHNNDFSGADAAISNVKIIGLY